MVKCRQGYEEVESGDIGKVVQLDNDGLNDLNVQATWANRGGTYWVRHGVIGYVAIMLACCNMKLAKLSALKVWML